MDLDGIFACCPTKVEKKSIIKTVRLLAETAEPIAQTEGFLFGLKLTRSTL